MLRAIANPIDDILFLRFTFLTWLLNSYLSSCSEFIINESTAHIHLHERWCMWHQRKTATIAWLLSKISTYYKKVTHLAPITGRKSAKRQKKVLEHFLLLFQNARVVTWHCLFFCRKDNISMGFTIQNHYFQKIQQNYISLNLLPNII